MIPRSSRLALWCLALLLSLSLLYKGRVPAGKGEGAALLRAQPGKIKVRLEGDFPSPGVYIFPDGTPVSGAIRLTMPGSRLPLSLMNKGSRPLVSGDVLALKIVGEKGAEFTIGRMTVKERMLFRIPLDPDQLDAREWSLLPGIGPVLSERIVEERHKNGDFRSLEGVLRVPGIGAAKLRALREYF